MESFKIENLTFKYPPNSEAALCNISFSVSQGEFLTICGKSGCGKTTLLRLLKPAIAPYGDLNGQILFNGKSLAELDLRTQSGKIGFVMQSPDNQIVTDKVWHELAFGLESLGYPGNVIRTRVAEMASFFGIEDWFYKNVTELSGGQKQLLNLASVMVMQPSVLILDEPTSQLDPIAAYEFIKNLEKVNRELGITVILTEHRLEEAFAVSDRVIVLDNGKIIADTLPKKIGSIIKNHDMFLSLPAPVRICSALSTDAESPVTVREGKIWLENFAEKNNIKYEKSEQKKQNSSETVVELKDVWFRYEKNLPDVIKGLDLEIKRGELFAIVGGNGTGKTTALSIIGGLFKPYRGTIKINGIKQDRIKNLYNGIIGVLPQNPQALFVKKTVLEDLKEICEDEEKVKNITKQCGIDALLNSHPYDLSGGEQQRCALAKVLLLNPEILLLDELTKGMDAHFKKIFAKILFNLKNSGVTIIMVSHDIEFCASVFDRCAMFFDGNIISSAPAKEFFAGNSFYTTSANRMARNILPDAVTCEDIIDAFIKKEN